MRTSKEFTAFNKAMDSILRADPKAVKEAMEQEKQTNTEKREAKKNVQKDKPSLLVGQSR